MHHDHLVELFLELVTIDSESLKEGIIASFITSLVESWGFKVRRDRAGKAIGSDGANLYVKVPSTLGRSTAGRAPTLLLSAHMDTVFPGVGVKPVVGKGVIRSKGHTILGADNKAGVAIILDILREVSEGRLAAGPLEVLLSIAEEKGILGIKYAELAWLKARHALVLDGTGEAEVVINSAPTQDNLEFLFKGRRAHAGVEPEKGLNAITGAARAIGRMKLGRIDAGTTANIGIIEGGIAVNIVPDEVRAMGEVRSRDPRKLETQRNRMIEAARRAEEDGMQVDIKVQRAYDGYLVPASDPLVRLVKEAGTARGLKMRVRASGGGSDANHLNAHGIKAIVLNTGAYNPHSQEEYLDLKEFHAASAVCRQAVEMYARRFGG
jgi:tripeptide aminopeptidase